MNGRTDLHIFNSATVNAELYVDKALDSHFKLFKDAIGSLGIYAF